MPYDLSKQALIQEFFLIQPEEDEIPLYVRVRRMNVDALEARRELLFSDIWSETDLDNIRISTELTIDEVYTLEAFYLLSDCNICDGDDFLFRFKDNKIDMTEHEFSLAWGRLPSFYQEQIVEIIHSINPSLKLQEVTHANI